MFVAISLPALLLLLSLYNYLHLAYAVEANPLGFLSISKEPMLLTLTVLRKDFFLPAHNDFVFGYLEEKQQQQQLSQHMTHMMLAEH